MKTGILELGLFAQGVAWPIGRTNSKMARRSDVYHGSTSSKEAVLSSAQAGMLEVMITTYTTYRLNKRGNMIKWDCVVADECHTFKARKSEIAGDE